MPSRGANRRFRHTSRATRRSWFDLRKLLSSRLSPNNEGSSLPGPICLQLQEWSERSSSSRLELGRNPPSVEDPGSTSLRRLPLPRYCSQELLIGLAMMNQNAPSLLQLPRSLHLRSWNPRGSSVFRPKKREKERERTRFQQRPQNRRPIFRNPSKSLRLSSPTPNLSLLLPLPSPQPAPPPLQKNFPSSLKPTPKRRSRYRSSLPPSARPSSPTNLSLHPTSTLPPNHLLSVPRNPSPSPGQRPPPTLLPLDLPTTILGSDSLSSALDWVWEFRRSSRGRGSTRRELKLLWRRCSLEISRREGRGGRRKRLSRRPVGRCWSRGGWGGGGTKGLRSEARR
ncbi:hypothetical protein BDY24DRAFT_30548 [Mrakia frigida]|uniref:uncharacterized protein n=1 Tax=Mrakia frigida TaxID=29902 RepID=UPI003FCC1DAE